MALIVLCGAMVSFILKLMMICGNGWNVKKIGKAELRVERFASYAAATHQPMDAEQIRMEYTNNLAEMGILFDDAMAVIQTVSQKIECSIASNGIGYVQRRRFAKSGIEPYFKHLFISEELQAEKPDPKFFKRVEEVLEIHDPKTNFICW